ncbi:hypothetical protein BANRA_05006 [Escherichia coli]|nr:hypothetical protein BANRA_05006 [Escherichia coli]
MAKVDQKLMLYCEQQELCRLGQIKIQYEFCTVIMLLKISILSCKTKLKKVSGAGANAQITAEPFLLLLMSQLTILVLINKSGSEFSAN